MTIVARPRLLAVVPVLLLAGACGSSPAGTSDAGQDQSSTSTSTPSAGSSSGSAEITAPTSCPDLSTAGLTKPTKSVGLASPIALACAYRGAGGASLVSYTTDVASTRAEREKSIKASTARSKGATSDFADAPGLGTGAFEFRGTQAGYPDLSSCGVGIPAGGKTVVVTVIGKNAGSDCARARAALTSLKK